MFGPWLQPAIHLVRSATGLASPDPAIEFAALPCASCRTGDRCRTPSWWGMSPASPLHVPAIESCQPSPPSGCSVRRSARQARDSFFSSTLHVRTHRQRWPVDASLRPVSVLHRMRFYRKACQNFIWDLTDNVGRAISFISSDAASDFICQTKCVVFCRNNLKLIFYNRYIIKIIQIIAILYEKAFDSTCDRIACDEAQTRA